MLGWIICRETGGARLQPEMRQVCDLPLLTLEAVVPRSRWEKRRLLRALRRLRCSGVERAVVQGPLPEELLAWAGIAPMKRSTLRRALLGPLLDRTEMSWGLALRGGTVILQASRTDDAAYRAALLLTQRARYVALDTGPGQEMLAEELRRRCGLGRAPAGGALLRVCMDGREPVLYLGEEGRQRLILTAPQLPEGEEMLFSALFETGKLKIEEISIKSVEFSP